MNFGNNLRAQQTPGKVPSATCKAEGFVLGLLIRGDRPAWVHTLGQENLAAIELWIWYLHLALLYKETAAHVGESLRETFRNSPLRRQMHWLRSYSPKEVVKLSCEQKGASGNHTLGSKSIWLRQIKTSYYVGIKPTKVYANDCRTPDWWLHA